MTTHLSRDVNELPNSFAIIVTQLATTFTYLEAQTADHHGKVGRNLRHPRKGWDPNEVVIDKNDETSSQVQAPTTAPSTNPFTPNTSAAASPMPPPPVIREPAYVDFNAFNDDRASNIDELSSMVSDDDSASQIPFDAAMQLGDDIFPDLAEEAIEVDEVQMTRRQMKHLERNVNAVSATLNNFNVVVSSEKGESQVTGYASTLSIGEELNVPLKVIFDKNRAPSTIMADKNSDASLNQQVQTDRPDYRDAQLQFQVNAQGSGNDKFAHVVAKLRGLDISLDDQVVSYLGAFVRDDSSTEEPLFLELSVEKSNIAIKNQNRRNPLRIHVGDLSVIDGAKKE
uniref:C2 domain-containing protein n=1 Tax=Panagrellus redivivus TaxID=6233 RepID=A0A7E4VP35_PANRE